MIRKLALTLGLFGALAGASLLSACNTMEGAGKDVSAAGGAVTNTAKEVKSGM